MNSNRMNDKVKIAPKVCYFCSNNIESLDYKDVILLRKFINAAGKILPRKRTGSCAKHQRIIAQCVKRARIVGLLPFVAK